MGNLGVKPYTAHVLAWRSDRLAAAHPSYNRKCAEASLPDHSLYNPHHSQRSSARGAGSGPHRLALERRFVEDFASGEPLIES